MKRDMSLVREILSSVEAQPAGQQIQSIETSCTDRNTLVEHVSLLIEADLLDGKILGGAGQGGHFIVEKLTWSGHDFLAAVKNDKIWRKVLTKIREVGTDLTLDLVKELAKSYLKQEIGIP